MIDATPQYPRYRKDDLRYWKTQYLLACNKVMRQHHRYKKHLEGTLARASGDKTLTLLDKHEHIGAARQLEICAADAQYTFGRMTEGLAPDELKMIWEGKIELK